jgi:diacylglycerol kinase family enzyme
VGGVAIIINPISGGGGHRRDAGDARAAIARRAMAASHRDAEVVLTRAPGHGAELARRFVAQRADLVIAWGGDGTLNEVAGPIIGTTTAFGIVRAGSGEGLARSLRVPRDPALALAAALGGPIARMDVGYFDDRHFLNVAGVGFDAAVGAVFNRRKRRGLLGYVTTTLSMIAGYELLQYGIGLGSDQITGRCFLIAFANGPQYGGNLKLSAGADPQDGWLDAVVIGDGPPLTQLWRTRHLLQGVKRSAAGIRHARVKEASVTGERLVCHVDGEPFETSGRIDVRIVPGALSVSGAAGLKPRRAE